MTTTALIGPSGPDEFDRVQAILGTRNICYWEHQTSMLGTQGTHSDAVGSVDVDYTEGFVSGGFEVGVINASYVRLAPTYAGSFPRAFVSGKDWLVSCRMKISGVLADIDASSEAFVGLNDYAAGLTPVRLGVYGAVSTVNFVLWGPSGTPMDSGIPIDNAYHDLRAYNRGGVATMEIDNIAVATGDVNTAGDTSPVWKVLHPGAPTTPLKAVVQWWVGAAVAP